MGGWQQLLSLPVYVSHVPYPSLYPLHSPPTATTPPTTTHRTSSYLDHLISSHLISSHLISSHPPLLLSPSPCQAPLPPSACPSLTPSLVRSPLFSSRKAKCCCPPAHWAPPSCCCSQVGRRTGRVSGGAGRCSGLSCAASSRLHVSCSETQHSLSPRIPHGKMPL